MSTDTTSTDDAPEAEVDTEPFDAERAKAKIAKANSEASALRRRLKELEAAKAKLDELEAAGKSEADKLRDQLAAAERAAQEAELRALRLEVAADKGLTPSQAKRLVGSTLEELEADADDLLADFQPAKGAVETKPTENLRPGTAGTTDPTTTSIDVDALVNSIPPTY